MTADHSLPDSSSPGGLQAIVPYLKTGALIVTILGAIPTAITAYYSWQFGVPITKVGESLAQYRLVMKNIDCKVEYKAINTTGGTKIDAGACPESGDISLRVSSPDGKSAYQWIAYNELQKPGEPTSSGGLFDLLIGMARAGDADKPVRVAQGAIEVMCQALVGKKELVRIVKEGGKCYRETGSPFKQTIDKREEVPCDTKCEPQG